VACPYCGRVPTSISLEPTLEEAIVPLAAKVRQRYADEGPTKLKVEDEVAAWLGAAD